MYFDDMSCHVQKTLQTTKELGIYELLKSDWSGIVVVMKRSNKIYIEDGYFDFAGIGTDYITGLLRNYAQEMSGIHTACMFENGYNLMVLPIRKDGRYEVFSINYKKTPFDNGALNWMRVYNKVCYENVLLKNEIAQEKNCVENIFENTTSAIMNIDLNGTIVASNPASTSLFGPRLSDGLRKSNIKDIGTISSIWPAVLNKALANQKYAVKRLPYTFSDQTRFLNIVFSPIKSNKNHVLGVVMTCSDETDKLLMERSIQQLKQFALLGEIATGVAHDVRNPLMNIRCSTRLLEKTMANQQGVTEIMEDIIHEVDRINDVIEQLLTYGDISQCGPHKLIDVNEIITQSIPVILRTMSGKYIKLETDLDKNIPIIPGNKTQIQQALLNVLFNALQAIPEKGVVSIKSQIIPKDNMVCLSVKDTGIGIPYDNQDKVLNHFVSTKQNGIGFGLSIVKRVVSNHQGRLLFESTPGEGTSVFIYLPCKHTELLEKEKTSAVSMEGYTKGFQSKAQNQV